MRDNNGRHSPHCEVAGISDQNVLLEAKRFVREGFCVYVIWFLGPRVFKKRNYRRLTGNQSVSIIYKKKIFFFLYYFLSVVWK